MSIGKRTGGKSLTFLLDRFDAIETGRRAELEHRSMSATDVRKSVENSLLELLNSRKHLYSVHRDTGLENSVLAYGIFDYLGIENNNESAMLLFQRDIEKTIEYFEPRLTRVSVSVSLHSKLKERHLFLRISGHLELDEGTDVVVYESAVTPDSQKIVLEQRK